MGIVKKNKTHETSKSKRERRKIWPKIVNNKEKKNIIIY